MTSPDTEAKLIEMRKTLETAREEFERHVDVFSVEGDEGAIRLSLYGTNIAAFDAQSAKGIALLKLAAAIRALAKEGT